MSDVPFLGSKISLISKCDIRYEGILYSVDPNESTIALSKVRSFGTEDRISEQGFVPIKDDVYELIIFRASDVKDLRVDAPEPPGLSDPAIIRAHHSVPPKSSAPGSLPTQQHQAQQQQQHQAQQKPLLPFLPSRSSEQQSRLQQDRSNSASGKHRSQPANEVHHGLPYSAAVSNQRKREGRRDSRHEDARETRDLVKRDERHGDDNRRDERSRDDNRHRGDMRRGDDRHGDRRPPRREYRNDHRDDRRNDNRDDRGGRRPSARNGYVSNHRGYDSYHYRRNQGDSKEGRRPPSRRMRSGERPPRRDPIKFDSEFDFEQANKEFLELEGKIKGLNLKDGEDKGGESSGEGAESKSTAGASESGSAYDSDQKDSKDGNEESVSGEFYDKTKSFFDNISCEAVQRSKGKNGKPDWRKERQTNVETFGVAGHYRRGGYRRVYGNNGFRR